jgi:hypothetical protein
MPVNRAREPEGLVSSLHLLLTPIVLHLHAFHPVFAAHTASLAERLFEAFDPCLKAAAHASFRPT